MPTNATRNLEKSDVDGFLGNGWFMGLGPERCLVAWGKPKKAKKPVAGQLQFFVPDFYLEKDSPWVAFENAVTVTRLDFIQALETFADLPKLNLNLRSPKLSDFEKAFQLVQTEISQQKLNKAVPVVFATSPTSMTKAMRAHFIRNLLVNAIKPTPYGYLTPSEGVLGASPEILFSYNKREGTLKTMALAGTRKSELERTNSLSNDEKEMFEHGLVVKGLKEKLTGFGDMQISPTYVWDLGTISHLRTDVSLELKESPNSVSLFSEMCSLLHPTAALGVSPTKADWRFLKTCDAGVDRGFFGAPFGVLSPEGRSIVLVAIRNMQWNEKGIQLGTGCGVVAQSELNNEWQELEIKRQSVCELFGL